jgi:hypothetical protein
MAQVAPDIGQRAREQRRDPFSDIVGSVQGGLLSFRSQLASHPSLCMRRIALR